MTLSIEPAASRPEPLPRYRELLLAVDSSDHANRGVQDGVALARAWGAGVTATHVYAARLHDLRFRQMEGGLPERFRAEQELERQRDVHNDLITRGLSIISDSYLDQVERAGGAAGVRVARRALEGKNYRELSREANSGRYDLLVLGALGLGAVPGSQLGTVCERVVRRSAIDALVIKSPGRAVSEGPIAVAIDGSPRAYGGLMTALALAQEWRVPLHVLSAFDPYYHYVAFNRIAGVLSEEARRVFRFKEQERLHEEIIDSGLARIYEGHLQVARNIAADYAAAVHTRLLDGKPHEAIGLCLRELQPSLLVIGRLGIHADDGLDIGGTAENLLRTAPCAVLLSERQFTPQVERLAEVSVSWTREAEERLQRAPSFVQPMARMAILRYAQERGHTVVTARLVEEATASLMPARAAQAMAEIVAAHDAGELHRAEVRDAPEWSGAARERLEAVGDASLRENLRLRSEKRARSLRAAQVAPEHVDDVSRAAGSLHWEAAALARLSRVPEGFMREAARERIESEARRSAAAVVTLELAEAGLAVAREAMAEQAGREPPGMPKASKCPFASMTRQAPPPEASAVAAQWTLEGTARLQSVPEGFCRTMTERAVNALARQNSLARIDADFVQQILAIFEKGSRAAPATMPWADEARARLERAPEAVRGMLVKEIESWARRNGLDTVDGGVVEAVKSEWQASGAFHLDPGDPRRVA